MNYPFNFYQRILFLIFIILFGPHLFAPMSYAANHLKNQQDHHFGMAHFGMGSIGIGFMLGEPSGLSGKLWLGQKHGLDFGLGYASRGYLVAVCDYLFQFPGELGNSSSFVSHLNPYLGIGSTYFLYAGNDNQPLFGVRIPFGMEWLPDRLSARLPLGVFLELAPGIFIFPDVAGLLQGGAGVRYYF